MWHSKWIEADTWLPSLCSHGTACIPYYNFTLVVTGFIFFHLFLSYYPVNFEGGLLSYYSRSSWKVLTKIFAVRASKKEHWLGSSVTWVSGLDLQLNSCVSSGNSFFFSGLWFSALSNRYF